MARGPNVVVYDVETKKLADELPGKWNDKHLMGVSSLAIWDFEDDRIKFYDDHNMAKGIMRLQTAELRFSFNGHDFDDPVLRGLGHELRTDAHYDILREAWKARGIDPDKPAKNKHGGMGLDAICKATIGRGKIDDGLNAVQYFREGRWAELFTYNGDDVFLTRDLALYLREHGKVISPKYGEIAMPPPMLEG